MHDLQELGLILSNTGLIGCRLHGSVVMGGRRLQYGHGRIQDSFIIDWDPGMTILT